MTQVDELRLQKLFDHVQRMVLLVGYLERTLATNLDDIKTVNQSLKLVTETLRTLPIEGGKEERS